MPKVAQKLKVMSEDSAMAMNQHSAGYILDSLLFCLIMSTVFGQQHLN